MNGLLSFQSVIKSVGGIVVALLILLVMVTIHEFGHYVAGKILGFKINEFSVGFGPAIFKKRNGKTNELFAVRVIPLGGYCAFEGEDELTDETETAESVSPETDEAPVENVAPKTETTENETVGDLQKSEETGKRFNDQPPWKRIIVLLAGVTMNYLLGLVLIFAMFFSYGQIHTYVVRTDPVPESVPEISENAEFLVAGDVVKSVNGKDVFLTSDYSGALAGKKAGDVIEIVVYRRNENGARSLKALSVSIKEDVNFQSMSDTGMIYRALGLDGSTYTLVNAVMKHGFFQTLGASFEYSGVLAGTVLRSLGELLTGKLGIDSMGGPVTTIKVTSQAVSFGGVSLFNIAALIGINLAVFNLLPVPALDGSKVIFCLIEWIRKKPVNRKVESVIHFAGIIFLFAFAILVDVLQFVK